MSGSTTLRLPCNKNFDDDGQLTSEGSYRTFLSGVMAESQCGPASPLSVGRIVLNYTNLDSEIGAVRCAWRELPRRVTVW